MSNTVKMIALGAIGVTRAGVTVYPEIGTQTEGVPFEFTKEEIDQIRAIEDQQDIVLLRDLRNEGGASLEKSDTVPGNTFTVENTANELKAEADRRGLDYSKLKTKADLVALLDANPASEEKVEDEDL